MRHGTSDRGQGTGMNYYERYSDFLRKHLKVKKSVSVVFDCSNGTTGLALKKLFTHHPLPITHYSLNSIPDGNFPAHGPDPWKGGAIPALGKEVARRKADCGVIFDADGDRVFFVDDRGALVPPDHTTILIAQNFKGPVILDVRQGFLVREWLREHKRKIIDSRVGHFFIKKLMRQKKVPFAAELSGHYYFSSGGGSASGGKDTAYWDSGILAAIQFLNSVSRLPGSLSEWINEQPKYWQSGEINFAIKDTNIQMRTNDTNNTNAKLRIMQRIEKYYRKRARRISKLDGLKMEFGTGAGAWWFSVRPSNTEDLLRLNVEAKDEKVLQAKLRKLRAAIRRE